MDKELLSVVTVGHVDHGKSTVIGRMLADAGALPEGKLEAVRENCRRNSKPFEYAFLLDALKNEQAQGITIDAARCFFGTQKRNYIIIDAPGHIEFLKNMVTGASRAEAALMVIDASRGVEENTRRHGYFLSMLGVSQVSVLINKMDSVGRKRAVFESVKAEFGAFLEKIGVLPLSFIPVSGMEGDNIVNRSPLMPWYEGPTLIEQLDGFACAAAPENLPLRLPVQGVYKFTARGDTRRIVAGTVESGRLRAGDRIVFYPSGKKTVVKTLEEFSAPVPASFGPGKAAGFTMSEELFVRRGEIACLEGESPPSAGVKLRANVFWLGRESFSPEKKYLLKCAAAKTEMRLESISKIINASSLDFCERRVCERNEVAECVLKLERPIAFDLAGGVEATSRFVIVDGYEIAGGGVITQLLPDFDYNLRNIRWSSDALTASERAAMTGRRGLVVWLTGLSGSGKTTIAQETERRLLSQGVFTYLLDGDKLRCGLNSDLGFSAEDRRENVLRAAQTAALFCDAGAVVLTTLISPFAESRELARRASGESFLEVYVKASLESCISRDPKGLYKKALAGEIESFTGLSSPYEPPESPELTLDTDTLSEESCVDALLNCILARLEDMSF
ncbi:MAG: adenylyl-sulfate kinase [Oscillospiraceae bacterium]|nr:adenylyl-sulfate kinase [Oscillospiraceae bacterium]